MPGALWTASLFDEFQASEKPLHSTYGLHTHAYKPAHKQESHTNLKEERKEGTEGGREGGKEERRGRGRKGEKCSFFVVIAAIVLRSP